jgi:hypothetical protein
LISVDRICKSIVRSGILRFRNTLNPTLCNCSSIHSFFQVVQLNCKFPLKQSMCPLSCPARSNHRHVPDPDSAHMTSHLFPRRLSNIANFTSSNSSAPTLRSHVQQVFLRIRLTFIPRKLDRFLRSFLLHSTSSPQQRPSNKTGRKARELSEVGIVESGRRGLSRSWPTEGGM